MSKLLNRPLRIFAWYALLLLACSIPVYYVVVDQIWLGELDEHNLIIKQRIHDRLATNEFNDEQLQQIVELWSVLEPGTSLEAASANANLEDSLYTVTRTSQIDGEVETDRFRGLQSCITINGRYYRLRTETNVEESDETLAAIALVTILFFGLLLLGFILLNRRISKQIWKPFYITLDKLRTFDLNKNPTVDFDASDIEEFSELNRELEKLILRSVSTYNQQKQFIENASHELQTPLAVLRTKLELLLQNEQLNKEQTELISGINAPLSRMSRLNKNLLLLAKIENQQFNESERIDVVSIVDDCLEMLGDYIASRHISVDRIAVSELSVDCDRTLLEMLLNNLLVNAIIHGTENGTLIVETNKHGIMVSNTGTQTLETEIMFKRFAKSNSKTQNCGLGLAIVKEICDRYDWKISYHFENGMHVFSVNF